MARLHGWVLLLQGKAAANPVKPVVESKDGACFFCLCLKIVFKSDEAWQAWGTWPLIRSGS
jgi:hypothetical protein